MIGYLATYLVYAADLTHSQQRVAICLAKHAQTDYGDIRPAVDTIARQLNVEPRHVRRVVKELRELGVIEAVDERPGRVVNYRLSIERWPLREDWGECLGEHRRNQVHAELERLRPDLEPFDPSTAKPRAKRSGVTFQATTPDIPARKARKRSPLPGQKGHPNKQQETLEQTANSRADAFCDHRFDAEGQCEFADCTAQRPETGANSEPPAQAAEADPSAYHRAFEGVAS